ncbi:MAG: transcription elongation factor subunit Spt4 [Nanoarchaeota archaeon]
MAEKTKVCKECGGLTTGDKCPICGNKQFLDKYKGKTIIFDKESVVAEKLGKDKEGSYALRY